MIPKTLFQLAGRGPKPPALSKAVLVMIDYQNEYLDGPLRLVGAEEAIEQSARLLAAARAAGTTIVHVAHKGAPGGAQRHPQMEAAKDLEEELGQGELPAGRTGLGS